MTNPTHPRDLPAKWRAYRHEIPVKYDVWRSAAHELEASLPLAERLASALEECVRVLALGECTIENRVVARKQARAALEGWRSGELAEHTCTAYVNGLCIDCGMPEQEATRELCVGCGCVVQDEPQTCAKNGDCKCHKCIPEMDAHIEDCDCPCVTCGESFDNNVDHFGKSVPAAMGEISRHRYEPADTETTDD